MMLTYVTIYEAILGGGHFYVSLDVTEVMGCEDHRLRLLHQLEVPEGTQLQGAVLKRVCRLVDNQHIQDNVVLVNVHIGLSIDRVAEACQLGHLKNVIRIHWSLAKNIGPDPSALHCT